MDEIRIAIVGLGSRGAGTWLGLLQGLRGYRVVALCDPIEALHEPAMAGVRRPAGVRLYRDYEDVLADPEVDAVALTVRCREQGALAAQALEAGKHVNAEVPGGAHHGGLLAHRRSPPSAPGASTTWRSRPATGASSRPGAALVRSGQLGQITLCEGQYFHYVAADHFQDPAHGALLRPARGRRPTPRRAPPGWQRCPPSTTCPTSSAPCSRCWTTG